MNEEKDFLSSLDREFKLNELFEKHNIQYPSIPEVQDNLEIPEIDLEMDSVKLRSAFRAPNPLIKTHRPWSHSNRPWSTSMDSEINRLITEYEADKNSAEITKRESIIDKLRALSGKTDTVKEQRKQILKSGFLNLLRDKIDFDDDGNLIDSNGTVMRSTGQVGLMFTRILNEMLENRKNPDQIENDLKSLFKNE